MKRKEELNENQTRPLSPVGPNRAVVGLLYVCFRITIFLVWLSPTSSATLSSLLTLSLYLSFAASLSAVFFLGNLSPAHSQSAILHRSHPQNEFCVRHIVKVHFGMKHTTPNINNSQLKGCVKRLFYSFVEPTCHLLPLPLFFHSLESRPPSSSRWCLSSRNTLEHSSKMCAQQF